MEFQLKTQVPFPMGLEPQTAELAQDVVARYSHFFAWVQQGENPKPEAEFNTVEITQAEVSEPAQEVQAEAEEYWLLSKWDIEYFYGLSRPADVGCACPFGWMEKVERAVDQQYPMFGVERFAELYEKAAHMAWLILKQQIFPDYNAGIAILAVFVLLGRNDILLDPGEDDLKSFVVLARHLIEECDPYPEREDSMIKVLGNRLKTWAHR